MMNRHVAVVLGIALSAFLSAQAQLVFNFDYTGSTEFNDGATGTARQSALESAASTVASWFNHTATITLKVTSSNDANSTTLASAGSAYPNTGSAGFGNRGIVGTKILGGSDANGATADGTVDVNFGNTWDLDDNVASDAFDFKSTIMHELLHAVGFGGTITENGSDPFGNAAGTENAQWAPYDQFVGNSSSRLIDQTTFALDGSGWNTAKTGGTSGLFFHGTNAKNANGGNPVALYSPSTFESGSTLHHLDDEFFTSQNLLMEAATDTGPGTRSLSAIEIGMLQDLGFSAVPEPSTYAIATGGILVAFAVARRSRRNRTHNNTAETVAL